MINVRQHEQSVAEVKNRLHAMVRPGMTTEEVAAVVEPLVKNFGKQARASVRAVARKIAKLPPKPQHPNQGLVKSSRGTWGRLIGSGRAASLTRAECDRLGLTPGPGNN